MHDAVTLTLMLGVLTMLAMAAAAGPLYAEAVSDAAVRLALESVPAGAAAKTAPVVRLNGGIDPESPQWTDMLRSLEEMPGRRDRLGSPRRRISTELHPKLFFDPVGPVRQRRAGSAPVRLFGVDDPAARLVVVTQAAGVGEGVWLPEPVARSTGVAAGDKVQVQLSGLPEAATTTTRVLGTYAVQPDGRTPQSPPGERLWADLGVEAFPSDAREPTQRAHLAVADLATTAALAKQTGDQLLWSAQARLSDPTPRLAAVPPHRGCRQPPAPAAHRALRAGRGPGGPAPLGRERRGGHRRPRRRAVVGRPAGGGRDDPGRHRPVAGARRGRGRVLDGAPPPRGAAGCGDRSTARVGRAAVRR